MGKSEGLHVPGAPVILVVDEHGPRRRALVERLTARGMAPLAPRTPLETIHVLTRTRLRVAMLAPASAFGSLLADSFPWVAATEIDDDLAGTVDRAVAAATA